jgi:hypothetical protein
LHIPSLHNQEDASFDFGESGVRAPAIAEHHAVFAPAMPSYPVVLLNHASWDIEAHLERPFISLRDLDLQQTHCIFEPPATNELFEHGDHDQNNFYHTSSIARASDAPNHYRSEQAGSGCTPNPKRRNALIKEWLLSNASSPYPSRDQLSDLSISSGLSTRQVQVCLSNLRARTKPGTYKRYFHNAGD